MPLKYFAGKLLNENLDLIEGYVGIREGVIEEVDKGKPPKNPVSSGIISPSFINAHTHVADFPIEINPKKHSLSKLVGPDGIKQNELKNLGDEEKREGIKKALKSGFQSGVTHFCDFREEGINGSKLLFEIKEKAIPDVKIFGRPEKIETNEIKELSNYIDGIGISGVNDFSKEELSNLNQITTKLGLKKAIHAGESLASQRESLRKTGKTEIQRALELDPDFIIHATNPLQNDLDLIEKNNVPVVLCPRSNYKTGVGLPPLEEIIELDTTIGLGTDNAMLNSTSILDELRFVTQKYFDTTEKISKEKLKTLFKTSTINSGKVIGIDNRIKEETIANIVIIQDEENLESIINQNKKIKTIIKGEKIQHV